MNNHDIFFDERSVPISTRFDDPYYSFDHGLRESEYVFLAGNDLPARFVDGFHIGEIGFGTGLNFLLAWQAFRSSGVAGKLRFTSFEAFPMSTVERAKSLSSFEQIVPELSEFADGFDGVQFEADDAELKVVVGDVRETLPKWKGAVNAWFLDGFSPAKNPETWGTEVMQAVYDHCENGGSAATYTAAGHIRQKLSDAGFTVERIKGYGHKRHMTRAVKS